MRHASKTSSSASSSSIKAAAADDTSPSLMMRAIVTALGLTMGMAVMGLTEARADEVIKDAANLPLGGTGQEATLVAKSELVEQHKDNAVAGQMADVGSTGIGLAIGAAEANPLGLLTLGIKAKMYQDIQEAPPVEQPRLWGVYGAFGWGATANNLCVIAAIATGGAAAALCPVLGVATGMTVWNNNEEERNRATFDAMCKDMQAKNPALQCVYRSSAPVAQAPAKAESQLPSAALPVNPTMVQHQSTYGEVGG